MDEVALNGDNLEQRLSIVEYFRLGIRKKTGRSRDNSPLRLAL